MFSRLGCTIGAVLVGLAIGLWAPASEASSLRSNMAVKDVPSAPGRLIVKYRANVNACVNCLLAKGISFATVTGTNSLDRLNRGLGVRGARPLAFGSAGLKGSRSAAYFNRLASIRARFPARTARAPENAAVPDLSNLYVLDLPRDTDVGLAAALYAADPNVEYAQPDYELKASLTPDDPFYSSSGTWQQTYGDLWGLHITDAGTAWDTSTGAGIVVAIIDTGIDYDHPDIVANMWTNPNEIPGNGIDDDGNGFVDDVFGWNFVSNTNDPMDDFGHGTHVAGTVAAVGDNGIGVVGMAFGARVMAVKGLDQRGVGYTSQLASAVLYAAENGADVLNNSWGGFSFNLATGQNSALRDAVETASALGVVVVASAGNAATNVNYQEPAGYPTVIAVGASDYLDERASFSNVGTHLSVVAPGVDVLSLRSSISPVDTYGQIVASRYLRLNGTSMASPHVAGLGALLLSAQPSLTPDEVRWHIELNADQPGYPGYEGQLFNPALGYGRINAARVFDTPPVTTRLTGQADLHAYADSVESDVASTSFLFTTLDPVAWTLSSPSWLPPSATSGSGPSSLSLGLDATGLAVGQYTGDVVVGAPDAVDGGAGFPVTLQTHSDPRIGSAVRVSDDYVDDTVPPGGVPVVGDGRGVFMAWERAPSLPAQLYAARVDGAGNVYGPYLIHTNQSSNSVAYHKYPAVAFDGANYLVVWNNWETIYSYPRMKNRNTVMAMRVSPSGDVLDPTPIVLMTHEDRGDQWVFDIAAGWDGDAYTVMWGQVSSRSNRGNVYARRVGADGTLRGKAKRLYPNRTTRISNHSRWIEPRLACVPGSCLFVWAYRSGATSSAGYYLDDVYSVRLDGGALADSNATHLIAGVNVGLGYPEIATNGGDYLIMAGKVVECSGALCGEDLLAARVNRSGSLIDSTPTRLNATSPLTGVGGFYLTSDGENYLVSFLGGGSRFGRQIFGFRVGPDLQPIDGESPGALLLPESLGTVPNSFGSSMAAAITGTPTHAIVTWTDTLNFDPSSSTVTWTNPISVQSVFPRALPAGFPTRTIGAIGSLSAREREPIHFALTAPSLDPATTTFSASGLPSGALLDPTGLFLWTPTGNEAGAYSGVHFEATDGTQTVSEDVTITVAEASLSLSGTVTVSGGAAAPGVGLKIGGPGVRGWTVVTDGGGNFRVEDLAPGNYTLRLDGPTRKQYVATPATTQVAVGSADVDGISIVVSPR